MEEEKFNHIVYSKNVIEFATVANEYCAFLEKSNSLGRRLFLEKIQKLLPLLYLKASLLPNIDAEETETPEKFLKEIDYNRLLNRLSDKLGSYDSYLEVFDQGMQFSETPVDSNISENLCDIYQDLKDFIFAFRLGTVEIMTDAVWECRKNFCEYWGQKLVNVLRAIHSLVYGENDLDEMNDRIEGDGAKEKAEEDSSWLSNHFNQEEGDSFSNEL
ncbi:MAG TPA: DUF5063 domain-containing protein [Prolixibacteraceae bacterium]|nr:DUF5063 domain-containing protein [Prolixibacteraceae bacterium]